jgi:hypothetical protein
LIPNRTRIHAWSADEEAFDQADTPAQAASPRITVHAGPKTQLGGFRAGLRRSRYQGPMVVIHPPTPSMHRTVKAAMTVGRVMTDETTAVVPRD